MLRYSDDSNFFNDLFSMLLEVQHRLFKYASDQPENCQVCPRDTLCTYLDQSGGAPRIDIIHYRPHRVVCIEVTVSNYGDAKIPSTEGDSLSGSRWKSGSDLRRFV